MPDAFPLKRQLVAVTSLLLATGLFTTACTFEHSRQKADNFLRQSHLKTDYQIKRSDNWVLHSETLVCLVAPGPGTVAFSGAAGARAHHALAQALHIALAQNFVVVEVPEVGTLASTARASALQGCSVTIAPRIIEARDQLNSWAEIDRDLGVFPHLKPGPDKLIIRVAIIDVVAARPLDIATVHGRTGIWTLADRAPRDMFGPAMQAYVAAISSKPHKG